MMRFLVVSVLLFMIAYIGIDRELVDDEDTEENSPLNVLFLSIDDLRPELGCYGVAGMVTPAIDGLAERGMLFTNAFCQFPSCGPSRVALLTGLRPETTGARGQWVDYRKSMPDVVVMPELFLKAGWKTRALGKIHHGTGQIDDKQAWSEPCWRPSRWQTYYAMPESNAAIEKVTETWKRKDSLPRVIAWEAPDVPASELPDGMIAEEAIRFLREEHEKPFFLAVGFLKPHMPFVAPKKYWDLYPADEVQKSPYPEFPKSTPAMATNNSDEVLGFSQVRPEGVDDEEAVQLIRGYRACVSFVDAQVGRVLAELDEQGLRESTVIVLWGDHGWHLGDQGLWGKHTNFEASHRSPIIVVTPSMGAAGKTCDRLVETVDLYPTLAELCGLEAPAGLEGLSMQPLLENPKTPWKTAVFGEYERRYLELGKIRGRSIRTVDYRFTKWDSSDADFTELELYDLREDRFERENLAGDPQYESLIRMLRKQLKAGWSGALPE
ncbi:MAG: iduronate 2-sulfatase [Planctomycetota bacterium]|jgi:iduronate 2-sulfatase